MRRPLALAPAVLALAAAGCGAGARHPATTSAAATTTREAAPRPAALRVGVVGPLSFTAPGAALDRGPLSRVAGDRLVLAAAGSVDPARLAAAAAAHPASHFALVGASAEGLRQPNLVGVVIREDEAALLAGAVAGLAAREVDPASPHVAWVGPDVRPLVAAFVRGAHTTAPGAVVLRQWSREAPVYCKEAAIAAVQRNATVLVARRGLCAEAAAAGAHEQGQAALEVTGFELRGIAAQRLVQEALTGAYYGGGDVVYGARSGAIGIGRLDPGLPAAVVIRAHVAAQQLATGARPVG